MQLSCLFVEFLTKPCSWPEACERLQDKPRFETNHISSRRKQELFEQHLSFLQQAQAGEFYELLKGFLPPIALGAVYETCQFRLQRDARFLTVKSDEERKIIFQKYQDDLLREAEAGFRALLKNMMTEITLSKTGKQFESALLIIQKDPRWRALDLRPEHRNALLEEYKAS